MQYKHNHSDNRRAGERRRPLKTIKNSNDGNRQYLQAKYRQNDIMQNQNKNI